MISYVGFEGLYEPKRSHFILGKLISIVKHQASSYMQGILSSIEGISSLLYTNKPSPLPVQANLNLAGNY